MLTNDPGIGFSTLRLPIRLMAILNWLRRIDPNTWAKLAAAIARLILITHGGGPHGE